MTGASSTCSFYSVQLIVRGTGLVHFISSVRCRQKWRHELPPELIDKLNEIRAGTHRNLSLQWAHRRTAILPGRVSACSSRQNPP